VTLFDSSSVPRFDKLKESLLEGRGVKTQNTCCYDWPVRVYTVTAQYLRNIKSMGYLVKNIEA